VAAIYIAALRNVPSYLYEAAIIDGAGAWARFRHISIPMITPVILFNTIVGAIWAFNYFTGAFIIGTVGSNVSAVDAGAPQGSLLLYTVDLYVNAFVYLKMGYASAMAWVLFLIILVCTFALLKSSSIWVHYDQI
jgi:multiple sugar transport system permease protein